MTSFIVPISKNVKRDMNLRSLVVHHRTFVVLLATIVLMELAHGIELIALFPLYLHDQMHEGADAIGVTLSSYLVTDIVMRTPAGWAADHWARKPILLSGIALSALPLLAMPRTASPTLFLLLNAINGIGAGCIWPTIYAAIADAYARERYGLVLGIVNMVMLGGLALGPIAGGFLLGRVDYATAFIVCFTIVALAFGLVVLLMRETHARTPRAKVERSSLHATIRLLNPTLVRLLFIGLLLTSALGMLLPLISLFGKEVLRLTPEQFALVLIPPGIITAAVIIPAGHFADRYGRHAPLIIGLGLVALPFALSPVSTHPMIVSLGATVAGVGYALLAPAWNALVMDYVPTQARGLFLGVIATAQGIGLALGPSLGGVLWERVGIYAPFELAAIWLVLALILSGIEMRRAK
jgi:MFS family permease